MTKWRLATGVNALVNNLKHEVWLSFEESKKNKKAVDKLTKNEILPEEDSREILIEENRFKLKFDGNLNLYIKSEEFPTDNWYKLMNFSDDPKHLGAILTKIQNNNGVFDEEKDFEAAFSIMHPTKVILACSGMDEYEDYLNELVRVVNCQTLKKTRKWIPGHRYDSETNTYYYLGKAYTKSYKDNKLGEDLEEVHLVVESLSGESKISEIMNNRIFGNNIGDIKIVPSISLMVDGGSVLENDLDTSNIEPLWEGLVMRAINKCRVIKGESWKDYTNIHSILQPLTLVSKDNGYSNIKNYIFWTELEQVIKVTLLNLVVRYDGVAETIGNIDINCSKEEAIDNIKRLYTLLVDDSGKINYYLQLLPKIGIDLNYLVGEILEGYSEDSTIFRDLESMYNFSDIYTELHSNSGEYYLDQRYEGRRYSADIDKDKATKLSSVICQLSICEAIESILEQAKEEGGSNITRYQVLNQGTRSNPILYELYEVRLKDIIKLYGSVSKVPENLKDELVISRFQGITIKLNKNSKIII